MQLTSNIDNQQCRLSAALVIRRVQTCQSTTEDSLNWYMEMNIWTGVVLYRYIWSIPRTLETCASHTISRVQCNRPQQKLGQRQAGRRENDVLRNQASRVLARLRVLHFTSCPVSRSCLYFHPCLYPYRYSALVSLLVHTLVFLSSCHALFHRT